ncbi:hypothetical protein EDC54_1057 [Samsonia erythrinae]|uniref:Uncharacterized protein n=1 Tax=Samsonia erythrinae TaxID=160434 RepID=A0A4R3VIW0_9GAMM|nr:hypothetical protein EDC54_1057 [Samsonia erythrinae]
MVWSIFPAVIMHFVVDVSTCRASIEPFDRRRWGDYEGDNTACGTALCAVLRRFNAASANRVK